MCWLLPLLLLLLLRANRLGSHVPVCQGLSGAELRLQLHCRMCEWRQDEAECVVHSCACLKGSQCHCAGLGQDCFQQQAYTTAAGQSTGGACAQNRMTCKSQGTVCCVVWLLFVYLSCLPVGGQGHDRGAAGNLAGRAPGSAAGGGQEV